GGKDVEGGDAGDRPAGGRGPEGEGPEMLRGVLHNTLDEKCRYDIVWGRPGVDNRIIVFPGSNCDADTYHVVRDVLGHRAQYVWHEERTLDGLDAVILPGGFAHGDYLRAGAIAATSPVVRALRAYAAGGGVTLGICNGFQVLLEA